MTTVNQILLKLEYLTEKQEEQIAFSALDDVITRFEKATTVVYSDAGVPLLNVNDYFFKQDDDADALNYSKEGERLVNANPKDLSPEDRKRAVYARGVRDNYNNTKQAHVKVGEDLNLLNDLYTKMMSGLMEGEPEGAAFRRRNQGKLPRGASELLSGFAQQADKVAAAIADGASIDEIKGLAFPKNGFRLNVEDDAGVDIQVRIRMNADGETFSVQQRSGGKGSFKTVKGGEKIKNFSQAMIHGERAIIAKARGREAQIAGVDVPREGKARRKWLNDNVRHEFQKPMIRGVEKPPLNEEEFAEKYADNTNKSLEKNSIDQKLINQSQQNNSADLFDLGSNPDAENIPSIIDNNPDKALVAIFKGILGGKIRSMGQLRNIVNQTSRKVASNPSHGAESSGGSASEPGSSAWQTNIQAKSGIGGFFSRMGGAFTEGFKEGWEQGQYFGSDSATYRPPDSKQYRENPRAYWQERGKLVTMMAQQDSKYEDSIKEAMLEPDGAKRGDMIEKAMVGLAKSEDTIEMLAKEKTGTSLGAIREHLNQIQKGNPNAMPPGAGFPNRFGGDVKVRELSPNVNKHVPRTARREPGALGDLAESLQGPRGQSTDAEGIDPGISQEEQGEARLVQQERPGGQKSAVSTQDREYLQPGDKAPEGVREYTAERRGKDGKQARYYSRKEAAAAEDEQKNGPSVDDPTEPSDPTQPLDPTKPSEPVEPSEEPTKPTKPSEPIKPSDPTEPSEKPAPAPTAKQKERLRGMRAGLERLAEEAGGKAARESQEPDSPETDLPVSESEPSPAEDESEPSDGSPEERALTEIIREISSPKGKPKKDPEPTVSSDASAKQAELRDKALTGRERKADQSQNKGDAAADLGDLPQGEKQELGNLASLREKNKEIKQQNLPPGDKTKARLGAAQEAGLLDFDDEEMDELAALVDIREAGKAERLASKKSQGSEVSAAGENEMATPMRINPQNPREAQNEQFQAAIETEVTASRQASQKSKARTARANATIANARADEAEVAAEDNRDSNIADILSKLDNNIKQISVRSNPDVSAVFKQLEQTIDSLEKQGGGGNPFASLSGHLTRAFKEMGKPPKQKAMKAQTVTKPTDLPEQHTGGKFSTDSASSSSPPPSSSSPPPTDSSSS